MLGSIGQYYSVIKEVYELRRNQYRKREDLERLQEKKLKKLITHAYNNVSLYNAKFKSAGIKPDDIRGLRDLSKIPLTINKENRDSLLKNVLSKGSETSGCKISFTSGTTGIPIKVYQSMDDLNYSSARDYYIRLECGVKLRDKIISLRVPSRIRSKFWFEKLGFLNIDIISIRQPIQNIIDKFLEFRPDILIAYPSIYLLLSEYLKNYEFNFKLGFSTGEILSKNIRKIINSEFKMGLFDLYGATESGRLAYECKQHEGLHIISDHNIIEFLKEGESASPGERGEIFITSLHNYAMPFIRYRLGDIGVLSDDFCSCGRTYPLIKYIEGRQDDFLTLPSGQIISPRHINILEYIKGISEFQIVQERRDRFLVNIVKGRGFSNNTIPDIKETIKSGCLGEEVYVDVKVVDGIERGRSGKIKNVISKV